MILREKPRQCRSSLIDEAIGTDVVDVGAEVGRDTTDDDAMAGDRVSNLIPCYKVKFILFIIMFITNFCDFH